MGLFGFSKKDEASWTQARDQADRFRERFRPKEGRDYGWVQEYARAHFARLNDVYNALDEKADSLMRYLGGGTGLFTVGTALSVNDENVLPIVAALPSVLLALWAIHLAARARRPASFAIAPSVHGAITYVEEGQVDPEAQFLSQWHATCEHLRIAVERKGALVQRAADFFRIALWGLLLPLITALALVALRSL